MTRCALKRNNKNVPKMWPKHLIVCLKPLKRFSLQTAGLYKHKPCFQIDQHNELEKYIDRDQAGRLGWRTFPRTDWMFRRSKVALFLALNFIDKWQNFIGLRHYTALLKRLVLAFIWSLSRSRTSNVISAKFSINSFPNRNLELKLPINLIITSNLVAASTNLEFTLQVVCNVQLSQTTRTRPPFPPPLQNPNQAAKSGITKAETRWRIMDDNPTIRIRKPRVSKAKGGTQVVRWDGGWWMTCKLLGLFFGR